MLAQSMVQESNLRMPLSQSLDWFVESQVLNSGPSVNQIPVPGCLRRIFKSCRFRASIVPRACSIFRRSSPENFCQHLLSLLEGDECELITTFRRSSRSCSKQSLIPWIPSLIPFCCARISSTADLL
jgi:hypothetical protein